MAMNLLFLISFSNVALSLRVVYAPPQLLLLLVAAVVTMALLAPVAMTKIEAQIRTLQDLIGATTIGSWKRKLGGVVIAAAAGI